MAATKRRVCSRCGQEGECRPKQGVCLDCDRILARERVRRWKARNSKRVRAQQERRLQRKAERDGREYVPRAVRRAQAERERDRRQERKRVAELGRSLRWWWRWGAVDFDEDEFHRRKWHRYYQENYWDVYIRAKRVDRARRELLRQLGGLTLDDLRRIALEATHCGYCGYALPEDPHERTTDHVVPLSRGGSNERSNIVACCRPCNSSKSARTVEEWRRGVTTRRASAPRVDRKSSRAISNA